MNKKVLIGLALLGVGAYMFRDKLGFGTTSTGVKTIPATSSGGGSSSPYEGMVVIAPGLAWAKILNGQRYSYQDYAGYLADGKLPQVNLSAAEVSAIPDSKREINSLGQEVARSW